MSELQAELDRLIDYCVSAHKSEIYRAPELWGEAKLAAIELARFILDHRDQVVMKVQDGGLEWRNITLRADTDKYGLRVINAGDDGSEWTIWTVENKRRADGWADTEAEARAAAEQWVKEHDGGKL